MARLSGFVLVIVLVGLTVSTSSAVELWAFDIGYSWGGRNESVVIDSEDYSVSYGVYPWGELVTLWDASYDTSTSTLYLSGGDDLTQWNKSTIAVYTGGSTGLNLVSASDTGLEDYTWLAGIEYIDGSLYAVGSTGNATGTTRTNFFVRIDNPGTSSQSVYEINSELGEVEDIGSARALCWDGQSGLYAIFASSSATDDTNLFHLDPATGEANLLRSYSNYELYYSTLEGLTFAEGKLYGVTYSGDLWDIDAQTYEPTEVANTWLNCCSSITAVPEPGVVVMMVGVVALVLGRRRR